MNQKEESGINSYSPSWFILTLSEIEIKEENGEIDFESMTIKELGVFAHEYTHYIQNLTSLIGLISSRITYHHIIDLIANFQKRDFVFLPLQNIHQLGGDVEEMKLFIEFRGTSLAKQLDFDYIKIIEIPFKISSLKEKKKIQVDFFKNSEKVYSIFFGWLCIKEGMAHHVQKKIDPLVKHPTLPYLIVDLICEKIYPEILLYPEKIIAVCISALNFQDSGFHFIRLLENYKKNSNRTSKEFMKDELSTVIVSNNKQMETKEFVIDSMKKLNGTLNILAKKTSHFNDLFTNLIEAENNYESLFLEVIIATNLTPIEKLRELKAHYGMPTIKAKDGKILLQGADGPEGIAIEMLILFSHTVMYSRLKGENGGCCGFLSICSNAEEIKIDEFCYEKQWEREIPCPFTQTAKVWGLEGKLKLKNDK